MLQIQLPAKRFWSERTQEFLFLEATTLKLEHSLISIQRWESKWHKSYLASADLTSEETLDYIRCMSLDPNISMQNIQRITREDFERIKEYIANPMTATTFSSIRGPQGKGGRKEIITAELVYYWMTVYGIPFECAKWHFNQLMTLIRVCGIKSNPGKGKSKKQTASDYAALNKLRRARTGSSG